MRKRRHLFFTPGREKKISLYTLSHAEHTYKIDFAVQCIEKHFSQI